MGTPDALVEWVDGLLRQFAPLSSQYQSWIAKDDKANKIAGMLWWYYATHPEENERTGISFGQRLRALVETAFWLQASVQHRGLRKVRCSSQSWSDRSSDMFPHFLAQTLENVGVVSFTTAIQTGVRFSGPFPDPVVADLLRVHRNGARGMSRTT